MRKTDDLAEIDKAIDPSNEESVTFKYSITCYGADYPVDSLVKRLTQEVIFIPHFQRNYVWYLNQASRFIESLLLGLPVPGIFLSKEADTQKLLVIDGQQRLKTLQYFYDGIFNGRVFRLKGVQEEFENLTYKTLEYQDRIRLDDSIIHATVVKQDEPSEDISSVYHIFERLNTGGTTLQPQEIRACIYHGKFNELLHDLSKHKDWRKIYGNPSNRLKDQEFILRFFALYYDLDNYKKPLKEFMNAYMSKNRELLVHDEITLNNIFYPTIKLISEVLGKNAFRLKQGISASVYDSVMVGLAHRLSKGEITNKNAFKERYYTLLENNDFVEACKAGTSDERIVSKRMSITINSFKELL